MAESSLASEIPRTVRAYWTARRRLDQAKRASDAILVGTFLGLLSSEALAALDVSHYRSHRELFAGRVLGYTDAAQITSGLFDWERQAIEHDFPARGRIIVTSAGSGREVEALLQLGYDAIGFEPNPWLCEAGRSYFEVKNDADRLQLCDRNVFPAGAPQADAVIVGWASYTHIQGRGRRVAFLEQARTRLKPGDPLLLSFWTAPDARRYLAIVRSVARIIRRGTGGEPVEFGDLLAPEFVHCFEPAEVKAECAAAGFSCQRVIAHPYPHLVAVAA